MKTPDVVILVISRDQREGYGCHICENWGGRGMKSVEEYFREDTGRELEREGKKLKRPFVLLGRVYRVLRAGI